MSMWKRSVLGAAGLTLLALVLSFSNAGQTVAEKLGDVLVINPPSQPIPVVGTVGLSPSANTVKVLTSAADPVLVRDVDNAARHPFQQTLEANFVPDQLGVGQTFTVPAGKRLVIEFVTGVMFTRDGQIADVAVTTEVNGSLGKHHLVVTQQGMAGGYPTSAAISQPMRVYADPGTIVIVHVNRTLGGDGFVSMSVSGYLVDVP